MPSLQERYEIIIEHLQRSIAYEQRFNQILEEYPHIIKDPILQKNREVLHYKKKIEDDDTLVRTLTQTQLHSYKILFPTQNLLETQSRQLSRDDTTPYRSIMEFRKYLFNYIKGIPGSKEYKQQIAMIRTYPELLISLEEFFTKAEKSI